MKAKTLKVTADSLAKAQEKLKSTIPDGYLLDTVTVIHDGKPRMVRVTDVTIDAAFAQARKQVPAKAVIAGESVLDEPKTETFQIEAFDEQRAMSDAHSQMWRRLGHAFRFKSIRLIRPGSRGIFGIGRKPNVYEARVFRPAFVEVQWRAEAEITASLLTIEGHIKKLIEELGNSKITWALYPEPDDSWAVEVKNEGKSIRESAFRALAALGAAAVPYLCKALSDSRKPKTPTNYPSYVYPRSAVDFGKNGPETKDEEEVGRTIADLLVEIGERDLVKQEAANFEGAALTRALWVLSSLGDREAGRQLKELSQQNDPEASYYLHAKKKGGYRF